MLPIGEPRLHDPARSPLFSFENPVVVRLELHKQFFAGLRPRFFQSSSERHGQAFNVLLARSSRVTSVGPLGIMPDMVRRYYRAREIANWFGRL